MLAVCFTLSASSVHAQDMASKIIKYFPGKWQLKQADGTVLGEVDWKVVAGGKAIAGPGKTADGLSNFALAGWDPDKKIWLHVFHQEDGSHARLVVTKLEGDTYHGEVSRADGDGQVVKSKWQNKVVDQNHFVVTEWEGDEETVTHFERVKQP
jgi:uncharacterized membrane protein